MSTALKPTGRPRSPSPHRRPLRPLPSAPQSSSSRRSAHRPPLTAVANPRQSAKVRRLPSSQLPLWLKILIRLQRSSMIVTFILVAAALIVYSSTVYTQQLWSKEYRKLKTLQRNEREMLAATEIGKDDLARQAERPGSGLIPQTPATTIFLQPAPPHYVQAAANPTVVSSETTPNQPLGY